MKFIIKVPATSANLGPGFDALGLALDLWNEAIVEVAEKFTITIEGEGIGTLAPNEKNLIVRPMKRLAEHAGTELPTFRLHCVNQIPLSSGMGSSAAAIVTGLLAANELLNLKLTNDELLNFAAEIEGHPDNVAPALMGGLVVSTMKEGRVISRKLPIHPCAVTIVLPEFRFPTKQARAVLPKRVSMKDAVYNISRAVLVTRALEEGDFDLLSQVIDDVLHQPYRLKLIPGAKEAMESGRNAGASAVVLSGAGPSLAAFSSKPNPAIGEFMKRAFESAGLRARVFQLNVIDFGAQIQYLQ